MTPNAPPPTPTSTECIGKPWTSLAWRRLPLPCRPGWANPATGAPLTASMFEVVTDNLLYVPAPTPVCRG